MKWKADWCLPSLRLCVISAHGEAMSSWCQLSRADAIGTGPRGAAQDRGGHPFNYALGRPGRGALANAQLAVAKAVLKAEFRREGATIEEAAAKAEEAVEKMASQLVFGRVPAQTRMRQRRARPEVKVVYFRSLFDAREDDGKAIVPATEQPVQLAMFAL